MTEADARAAVVAEARSFVNTPYHHFGKIKGVGVDCATLISEVFTRVGMIAPVDTPEYSPQWFMHQSAELYMREVLRHAHRTDAPLPGDVALWKVGRCFAHGAIVINPGWPAIIHAYQPAGIVLEANGTDAALAQHKSGKHREVRFFTLW